MNRVVVVGGSIAAVNAVDGLRRHGHQGEISLVSAEDVLPYDRPPLSKDALRDGLEHHNLLIKTAEWYDEHGVELKLATAAVGLDTANKAIALDDGSSLDYDGLVIATGCNPRPFGPLAGVPNVHEIRTLSDSVALREQLLPGRHLVVIGAGFIGLEVAATARKLGLDVSVVEIAQVPLTRVLGTETGEWFRDYHVAHGVSVQCGVGVGSVDAGDGGTKLTLSDGTVLSADLILVGVGVVPATNWLAGSGIEIDNGIVCDPGLRTNAPDVVAAGDIVRWHNPLFDESMRVEQWLNAVDQGSHAAATLLGNDDPFSPVPYFWSDQFDAKVKFVGRADASDEVHVTRVSDTAMIALFGRDDLLRGALCVNAPRQLARYKQAIQKQTSWHDAVDAAAART